MCMDFDAAIQPYYLTSTAAVNGDAALSFYNLLFVLKVCKVCGMWSEIKAQMTSSSIMLSKK